MRSPLSPPGWTNQSDPPCPKAHTRYSASCFMHHWLNQLQTSQLVIGSQGETGVLVGDQDRHSLGPGKQGSPRSSVRNGFDNRADQMSVPFSDWPVSDTHHHCVGIWMESDMGNRTAWQAFKSLGTWLFPPPRTACFHQETLAANLSTACPRHPGPVWGRYVIVWLTDSSKYTSVWSTSLFFPPFPFFFFFFFFFKYNPLHYANKN